MPAPLHYFDMEFNEELKNQFLSVFPSFEDKLLKMGLIKSSLEEYKDDGEAVMEKPKSVAHLFWMKSQGSLRYFLIKEKHYKCYGTQVWLQAPSAGDVSAWFENLLNS